MAPHQASQALSEMEMAKRQVPFLFSLLPGVFHSSFFQSSSPEVAPLASLIVQVLTNQEVSGKYGVMLGSTTPELLKHSKTFSLVPKIFEKKPLSSPPNITTDFWHDR